MAILRKLDDFFQHVARLCGVLACLAMILMLLNVFYDVIARYAFNDVSIGMQELEWHLFAAVFLLGIPYAIYQDGHVRVDIFYEGWSDARKAWINLLGSVFFTLPFVALVGWYGIDFTHAAYQIGEGSGDPGGLTQRWLVKSLIPLSAALTGIASLGMITRALRVLVGGERYPGADVGRQL